MKPDTEDKHSQELLSHRLELINDIGRNVAKQLAEPPVLTQLKAEAARVVEIHTKLMHQCVELTDIAINRKLFESTLCVQPPLMDDFTNAARLIDIGSIVFGFDIPLINDPNLLTEQLRNDGCIIAPENQAGFKPLEHKTINNYQITNNHNHHYYSGKDQNATKAKKAEKEKSDSPTKSVYMTLGLLIKELGYYKKYDQQGRKGGQEATINHIRDLAKEYGLTSKNLSKTTLHRIIKDSFHELETSKEDWE
ncbi:hypothetical protein [Endozoicomonas acroporae]|uniref:hypothetical protein n=1 Tax=Endozoicomonas acroporae TaxID=1701104 RepID=UPI0013D6C828|nr:hypothetical protein [Endozoicomonas acroporae]